MHELTLANILKSLLYIAFILTSLSAFGQENNLSTKFSIHIGHRSNLQSQISDVGIGTYFYPKIGKKTRIINLNASYAHKFLSFPNLEMDANFALKQTEITTFKGSKIRFYSWFARTGVLSNLSLNQLYFSLGAGRMLRLKNQLQIALSCSCYMPYYKLLILSDPEFPIYVHARIVIPL
jgi:hypothetical protein